MQRRPPPLRARLAFVFALPTLCAADASAQTADPFAAGQRWVHRATTTSAWLPTSVDFAAGGELVWSAGAASSPRLMLFSTPEPAAASGETQPWFQDTGIGPALTNLAVRGSPRADRLFAVAQYAQPDGAHRRTEVSCRDALAAAAGGAFVPKWTHDLGLLVNGAARICVDSAGELVVAVVHDGPSATLRVDWIDGTSGALRRRIDLTAPALRQIALSADGSRLAVVAGAELWVLSSSGATLHHESLAFATNALAIAGDGRTLLVGTSSTLRVLGEVSGGFVQRAAIQGGASEMPVRAAISHGGDTYAIGWWNATTGLAVRFEVLDGATDARLWHGSQSPGTLQNFPEVVLVSRDGRRAAFGCWGAADAQPEVVLYDRQIGAPIVQRDLGGSVLSMALDASGTRLAIGKKHGHANQFASTGEVQLFDTGERDVQLVDQAQHGALLHAASRRAGARSALYLIGVRSAAAKTLPGLTGVLWLHRHAGIVVIGRAADASGRADLLLPIGASPSEIGVHFAIQCAWRTAAGAGLSACVLDPLVF